MYVSLNVKVSDSSYLYNVRNRSLIEPVLANEGVVSCSSKNTESLVVK